MPHKGEKSKLNYIMEDLEQAIKKVRTGRLAYRRASELYLVPKSSDQINKHSLKAQPKNWAWSANFQMKQMYLSLAFENNKNSNGQMKPDLFDRVQ